MLSYTNIFTYRIGHVTLRAYGFKKFIFKNWNRLKNCCLAIFKKSPLSFIFPRDNCLELLKNETGTSLR